jgi:hypothetical protein
MTGLPAIGFTGFYFTGLLHFIDASSIYRFNGFYRFTGLSVYRIYRLIGFIGLMVLPHLSNTGLLVYWFTGLMYLLSLMHYRLTGHLSTSTTDDRHPMTDR